MTEDGSTGVSDETIIEVLRESEHPALKTTQVATELPITQGRTRTRLQTLVDEGVVERERVGINVVWWLAERDDEVGDDPSLAVRPDEDSEDSEDSEDAVPAVEPEDDETDEAEGGTVDADDAAETDETDEGESVAVEAVEDVDEPESTSDDETAETDVGPETTEATETADESDGDVGLDREEPRVVEFEGERDDGPPVSLAVGALVGAVLLWYLVRRLR